MVENNLMTKPIRISALMPYAYDTTPSQRFRIEQWEPYLRNENISIDYFSFVDKDLDAVLHKQGHLAAKIGHLAKASIRRLFHTFAARKYDVVFVHRGISIVGPALLERLLKLFDAKMIFDFDDSIFLADTSDANKFFGWAKFVGKIPDICRLSTSITVGNSYLAEYARRFNDNVFIVPTSIDINCYQPVENEKTSERIVVGWTGSSTSQYHLEAFEPVLAELIKKRGNDVEIRVISNREPSFKTIPYTWREWSPQTEVKEIAEIDIGIMPTPDDEWSRGKCALKALQYMSLGIPAICTDMGANRDAVNHGENGFLAKSPEQWFNYFETLIDDSQLRLKLGKQARETIVESYSMKKCAEMFAEVVRHTVKRAKVRED